MTGLADVNIRQNVHYNEIGIDPFIDKNIQPSSYDLTLDTGNENSIILQPITKYVGDAIELILYYISSTINNVEPDYWALNHLTDNIHALKSQAAFTLLSTRETVRLPAHIQGEVYGRSSLARKGVFVHVSAGFIDPGFNGTITLECINVSGAPVELMNGDRIAQIAFQVLLTEANKPYSGRYQNQSGATESRFKHEHEEVDITDIRELKKVEELSKKLDMSATETSRYSIEELSKLDKSMASANEMDHYLINGETAMQDVIEPC